MYSSQPNLSPSYKRKFLKIFFQAFLIVSVVSIFLYFTLKNLDLNSFWEILKSGKYKFVFFILPLSSISYFLRALRWKILIQKEKKMPIQPVFWANMVGYLGNSYLPARAGEIMRSVYLGEKSGEGTSFILATAFSERILDALVLVIVASSILTFQTQVNGKIVAAMTTIAIVSFAALFFIIIIPYFEHHLIRLLCLLPFKLNLQQKIIYQFQRLLSGLRSLQNLTNLSYFIILTAIIWLIDGVNVIIGSKIISQSITLGQALILLASLGFSSAIPSTPGYVGVYQFIAVTILVPFGFSKVKALAYIVLAQILNYIVITFWGTLGLSQTQIRFSKQSV